MTLTTSDMTKIQIEETLGKSPSIKSPEADAFREAIRKDIEDAKKQGLVIEIVPEFE